MGAGPGNLAATQARIGVPESYAELLSQSFSVAGLFFPLTLVSRLNWGAHLCFATVSCHSCRELHLQPIFCRVPMFAAATRALGGLRNPLPIRYVLFRGLLEAPLERTAGVSSVTAANVPGWLYYC